MAFAYRDTITVTSNATLLPSTQTNFPVLVSVTDTSLKTVGNGGKVQSANGYDIRFFSDFNLTAAIAFELEAYDGSAGTIAFWVLKASLALSSVFYAGFGDASLTTNSSSTSVWDSNYKGVWHLPDGTTLGANDSTSNANNGTITGATATSGQIGGAGNFNGTTQFISKTSAASSSLAITGQLTISAWIFWNTGAAAGARIVAKVSDVGTDGYELRIDNNPDGQLGLRISSDGTSAFVVEETAKSPQNAWRYVVATFDPSTAIRIYANASQVAFSTTSVPAGQFNSPDPFNIGSRSNGTGFFTGKIDEVRVSSTVRSPDWITAEYNNQSSPGTFLSHSFLPNRTRLGSGFMLPMFQ